MEELKNRQSLEEKTHHLHQLEMQLRAIQRDLQRLGNN